MDRTFRESVAQRPWGAAERFAALGAEDATDAGYLAGSSTKLVFASRRSATSSDLYLFDPQQAELPEAARSAGQHSG